MVLSDSDIRQAIESGRVKVDPAPDFGRQLNPCSLDLRLGHSFKVFKYSTQGHIDTRQAFNADELLEEVIVPPGRPFYMQPGELVLATTHETLEIPADLMVRLDGRSSLGRLGIIVHGTAGVFHPGWSGRPTLELANLGRIAVALYPMMQVCSITFHQLTSPAAVPYGKRPQSKYTDPAGPEASKLWMEGEEIARAAKEDQEAK